MLGFVLFIRTLAVGIMFIMSALYSSFWFVGLLRTYDIIKTRTAGGFISLGIIGLFWFVYRRYFQQYIVINNNDDANM